jgi:riboflavin biosynthesis pyrimidine reductase
MTTPTVLQLYPPPHRECILEGLYLEHPMGHPDQRDEPFVYTNFISSLDGRIAVENPKERRLAAPKAITNARDWRLFQELAARADALIVSASFLRNLAAGTAQDKLPLSDDPIFADLHDWRRNQGMTPQPALVILSRSLDVPLAELGRITDRPVYLAVGQRVDQDDLKAAEEAGLRILTAGSGDAVEGKALIDALAKGRVSAHLFHGGTQGPAHTAAGPGPPPPVPHPLPSGAGRPVLRHPAGRRSAGFPGIVRCRIAVLRRPG